MCPIALRTPYSSCSARRTAIRARSCPHCAPQLPALRAQRRSARAFEPLVFLAAGVRASEIRNSKGVPIQVVQNNLGHASIGTTSGYLTTERDARLAAMKGFGEKNARGR